MNQDPFYSWQGVKIVPSELCVTTVWRWRAVRTKPRRFNRSYWQLVRHPISRQPAFFLTGGVVYMHPDLIRTLLSSDQLINTQVVHGKSPFQIIIDEL